MIEVSGDDFDEAKKLTMIMMMDSDSMKEREWHGK